MSFIAGIGFANCDLIYGGMPRIPKEGEEYYSQSFEIKMGGGVPATLINLYRLNVPVYLGTFLGKDQFSGVVRDCLEESGINYENFYHGNGKPVSISSIAVTANDRTMFSYRDNVVVDNAMEGKLKNSINNAKIVEMHWGFLDLYKALSKEDKIFVLDTGWSDDMSLEKYSEYFKLADYYTPNSKEAQTITGTENLEEALEILGRYFEYPIIKIGKDGCMVLKNGEFLIIPPLEGIVPVDFTGAGDAFLSGFMYGLYHDYPVEDCILFGNVTGGLSVQETGCLGYKLDEPEVLKLFRELRSEIKNKVGQTKIHQRLAGGFLFKDFLDQKSLAAVLPMCFLQNHFQTLR